jgi:hypothetical protein
VLSAEMVVMYAVSSVSDTFGFFFNFVKCMPEW